MTRSRPSSTSIRVTVAPLSTSDWMKRRISTGTKLLLPPPMTAILMPMLSVLSAARPLAERVIAHRQQQRLPHPRRAGARHRVQDRAGNLFGPHHVVEIRVLRGAAPAHRELGRDTTRAQDRAADPSLEHLVVEGPHEADLGELRSRVDGLALGAALTGH